MNINYDPAAWQKVFAVPAAVADCVKIAPHDCVKTILYILRHNGETLSAAEIARGTGVSEGGVSEAVEFWQTQGVLAKDKPYKATDVSAVTGTSVAPAVTGTSAAPIVPTPPTQTENSRIFTPSEISDMHRSDPNIRHFFDVYETKIKRPLNGNERNTAAVMADSLPVPVCMMLLEYCFKNDKGTPAYLRTTARDWHNRDINTVSLAEAEIVQLDKTRGSETRMIKMFGLQHNPTKSQVNKFNTWTTEWRFSDEMIMTAFETTVDHEKEFNINYMNGILKRWEAAGIYTKAQLEQYNKSSKDNGVNKAAVKSRYASLIHNKALQRGGGN